MRNISLVVSSGKYAGPQGLEGAQGPTGADLPNPVPAGTMGRRNAAWIRVMPLVGIQEPGANMGGAISMGSAVAPGGPLDVSRHIDLWGGAYGLNVTDSTLNYVSGGPSGHFFYTAATSTFYGGNNNDGFQFTIDNWRLSFNRANGDLIYYNWAGNPLVGFSTGMNSFIIWGYWNCNPVGSSISCFVNGRGVVYANVGSNGFNFNTDGAFIYGRVDNAVQYPFAPSACDEELKQDIAPSTFDCLAVIRRVRLWQYRWRDHLQPGELKPAPARASLMPIGFVAQRLYEDCPEIVHRPAKDPDRGAMSLWNVERLTMLATLAGALKQLDAEVVALKARSADASGR